jgi:hypothetical protein
VWNYLLKESRKIVTIGVGIPLLYSNFVIHKKSCFLFMTKDDAKECFEHFKSISGISDDSVVEGVLDWVLEYTGGQAFPFYFLCRELLTNHKDACNNGEFERIVTGSEFMNRSAYKRMIERAFSQPNDSLFAAYGILETGEIELSENKIELVKCGLWNEQSDWFISNLYLSHLFLSNAKYNNLYIDWSKKDAALKVILFGLSELSQENLVRPGVRNLVSIGYQLSRIPQLCISPQTQVRQEMVVIIQPSIYI